MDEENELIALRRKKLDALRANGIEPFGAAFEVRATVVFRKAVMARQSSLQTAVHTAAALSANSQMSGREPADRLPVSRASR